MQTADSALTHQQVDPDHNPPDHRALDQEVSTDEQADGPCLVIVSRPGHDRDHHAFHRMTDAIAYLERLQNSVPPIPAQVFTMHEVNDIDLR